MRRVIIESPLSGDVIKNTEFARACLKHSLQLGEAPLISHLLYTQVLDDTVPNEREKGMNAGFAWNLVAEVVVVYTNLGISRGMKAGIALANENNIPVEYRTLPGWELI